MFITVTPGGNPEQVAADVRKVITFGRIRRAGHCVLVELDDVPGNRNGAAFTEATVASLRGIAHVGDIQISDHEMTDHFCPWRT